MTQFTDPTGNPVYIDLRKVIAISRESRHAAEMRLGHTNGPLLTYLWTSPNLPDGYFGVQESVQECLVKWRACNSEGLLSADNEPVPPAWTPVSYPPTARDCAAASQLVLKIESAPGMSFLRLVRSNQNLSDFSEATHWFPVPNPPAAEQH
jgi:hypothetical protein